MIEKTKGNKTTTFYDICKELFFYLGRLIRPMIQINKTPIPWRKGIGAIICNFVPLIIGYLCNELQWAAMGALGALAYLYSANETYGRRGRKMIYVVPGFTLVVFLGGITSHYAMIQPIVIGMIGAVGIFIFGVYRMAGPSALFFILLYLISSSKPLSLSEVCEYTIIVFLSSLFSSLVSMVGILLEPRKAEERLVKNIFAALGTFSSAIGHSTEQQIRNQTVVILKESENMLLTAHETKKSSNEYKKLLFYNLQANRIFHQLLEFSESKTKNQSLDTQIIERIKGLPQLLEKNNDVVELSTLKKEINDRNSIAENATVESATAETAEERKITETIISIINETIDYVDTIHVPIESMDRIKKSSKIRKIRGELKQESMVMHKAIRFGIVLVIASFISHMLPILKPYWIPLSCASVMLGGSVISTFNRAFQRTMGTILGVCLVGVILSFHINGLAFVIVSTLLSAIIELLIVKNYALAMLFITSNALLIAEHNTSIGDVSQFINARMLNVFIGSMIALIGTLIISRRSASSRVRMAVVSLIESQKKVIETLTSTVKKDENEQKVAVEIMDISLNNVKDIYVSAIGETGNKKYHVQELWSYICSLEYVNYLLHTLVIVEGNMKATQSEREKLLLIYENMIDSIANSNILEDRIPLVLDNYIKLPNEINRQQDSLYEYSTRSK